MASSDELKNIFRVARPLIEQQLDLAELVASLRDLATEKGFDWSQIKALLKAQVQDERDENGGKRVQKIVEKAEFACAYADMLGLANMNENNFSPEQFDAETGQIISHSPASRGPRGPQADTTGEDGAPPSSSSVAPSEDGIPEFLKREVA